MTGRAAAVITAGFFTVSIAYAIRYGYGMLLPEMLRSLSISKTEAGVIYASYFFAYTICSPVLGVLSDRFNTRLILTIFTALLGAGAFCMAFASSVLSAAVIFSLAGIGNAACWAPVVGLVQKWAPDRRRGAALAFTSMGSGTGIAVWSLLLPFIVEGHGWKAGWISMGLFAIGVAGLNGILVRNPDDAYLNQRSAGFPGTFPQMPALTLQGLFKHPPLWFIGLSYMLVGYVVLVPYTFVSVYASEELALSYGAATRLIAVIAVTGMIGKLILGIMSDTLGRIKVMIICAILLGLGCLGIATIKNAPALYVFTGIFGLGFGSVWPVYAAAASDFFPKRSAGTVIGLWTVFLGVGSIISPVICGWTIDRTGGYFWAFLSGTIGAAASVTLLAWMLRPVQMTHTRSSHAG